MEIYHSCQGMVIKTEQYCKKMEVNLSSLPQSHAQRTHYDVRVGVSKKKKQKNKNKQNKTKQKRNKNTTTTTKQKNASLFFWPITAA